MLKYRQNPAWVRILNSTRGKMIVEDSSMQTSPTSWFWGAKDLAKAKLVRAERKRLNKLGTMNKAQIDREILKYYNSIRGDGFEGFNTMGKLLTSLRDNDGQLDYRLPEDIYILGNNSKMITGLLKSN